MSHTAIVSCLPKCDMCGSPAIYDARIPGAGWAYLCEKHFKYFGLTTGTGNGQRLIVRGETYDDQKH